MTALRKFTAALVALLLILGLVGYMGYLIYDQIRPSRTASAPAWSEQDERVVTAVRARRRVPLAQVPWTLNVANPEEVLVGVGSLPWRVGGWPSSDGVGAVAVSRAELPLKFPMRRAADEPLDAVVGIAGLPWTQRKPGDEPAKITLAQVPSIKRIPDPLHPDAVMVSESRVPWIRGTGEFAPVALREAAVPAIRPMVEEKAADPTPEGGVKSPALKAIPGAGAVQSSTQAELQGP